MAIAPFRPNSAERCEVADVAQKVRFQPSLRALALLHAVEDILLRDGKLTHEAIASGMGLKADALRKWLRRHPEMMVWVRSELAARRETQRELLFTRCFNLAMRGSSKHADWCARVAGWFAVDPNGGELRAPSFIFNVLIPRR